MKRLFVAIKIVPDTSFLSHYELVKERLKANKISWVKPEHFHTTLKFLGSVRGGAIPAIEEELSAIRQNGYDIKIRALGIFGSRYKPRVLWAKIEDLGETTNLAQEVADRLEHLGFLKDRQNFVPHLTLGRIRKLHNTAYFQSQFQAVKEMTPFTAHIENFFLYESVQQDRGVEYRILGDFPLL